jgi:hypothetical protein
MSSELKQTLKEPHYRYKLFYMGGVSQWYLTNAPVDVVHDGKNYQSNGLFIDGTLIKEQADLKSDEAKYDFADFDRHFTNILLTEGYINRWVRVEYCFFNHRHEFVGVRPIFAGTVSNLEQGSLSDDSRPPLTLGCQWLWNIGETPAGRNCSDGSQKAFFPNDKSLEFINNLGIELPWGRE